MTKSNAVKLATKLATQMTMLNGERYAVEVMEECSTVWVCRVENGILTGDIVKKFQYEKKGENK